VAEITWENRDQRLVIRKAAALAGTGAAPGTALGGVPAATGGAAVSGEPAEGVSVVASATASGHVAPGAAGNGRSDETTDTSRLVSVVSPMVGTFYRAPAPDAPPYVEVGDLVEVGDPLCIIEAMKLMNEIESEVRGRVREILVESGDPVEYGQVLFILEKEPA